MPERHTDEQLEDLRQKAKRAFSTVEHFDFERLPRLIFWKKVFEEDVTPKVVLALITELQAARKVVEIVEGSSCQRTPNGKWCLTCAQATPCEGDDLREALAAYDQATGGWR